MLRSAEIKPHCSGDLLTLESLESEFIDSSHLTTKLQKSCSQDFVCCLWFVRICLRQSSRIPRPLSLLLLHQKKKNLFALLSTKMWQNRIRMRSVTHVRLPDSGLCELIETNQESANPEIDWEKARSALCLWTLPSPQRFHLHDVKRHPPQQLLPLQDTEG